ncbi:diphthine synthase [archaeon]|nr:diphthine synthase [archaeon]
MLLLVGLGLGDPDGITLRGLNLAKQADIVILDAYTSVLPEAYIKQISALLDRSITIGSRYDLEDRAADIIEQARTHNVCILVPGDPLIATTHLSLIQMALQKGIPVDVVNGVSIHTAAISLSGLHIYKFGPTVTIPLEAMERKIRSPADRILENLKRGLHTLTLLEYDAKRAEGVTVNYAARYIHEHLPQVYSRDQPSVAVIRAGFPDAVVVAAPIYELEKGEFPPAPHTLIVTGDLHFTEEEWLRLLQKAPPYLGRASRFHRKSR